MLSFEHVVNWDILIDKLILLLALKPIKIVTRRITRLIASTFFLFKNSIWQVHTTRTIKVQKQFALFLLVFKIKQLQNLSTRIDIYKITNELQNASNNHCMQLFMQAARTYTYVQLKHDHIKVLYVYRSVLRTKLFVAIVQEVLQFINCIRLN